MGAALIILSELFPLLFLLLALSPDAPVAVTEFSGS